MRRASSLGGCVDMLALFSCHTSCLRHSLMVSEDNWRHALLLFTSACAHTAAQFGVVRTRTPQVHWICMALFCAAVSCRYANQNILKGTVPSSFGSMHALQSMCVLHYPAACLFLSGSQPRRWRTHSLCGAGTTAAATSCVSHPERDLHGLTQSMNRWTVPSV
jgi:hypothetical protein